LAALDNSADQFRAELSEIPPELNHFGAATIECRPLLKKLRHVHLVMHAGITAHVILVRARTSDLSPVIEGLISSRTKVSECPNKVEEGGVVIQRSGEGRRVWPSVVFLVNKGVE
jgi:hypothetical protein